jgi:hypothetical protein
MYGRPLLSLSITPELRRCPHSETQAYRTSENRTDQARKERLWRQLLGVTYVLTVVFTSGEGQVSISLES